MANNQSKGQGNFGNHKQHVDAGRQGAEAQPISAKRKGGENSHKNDR